MRVAWIFTRATFYISRYLACFSCFGVVAALHVYAFGLAALSFGAEPRPAATWTELQDELKRGKNNLFVTQTLQLLNQNGLRLYQLSIFVRGV